MIYLDNSATTNLTDAAKKSMISAMECFGNPSSKHIMGTNAKKMLDIARENIGKCFGMNGASNDKIFFTASGTEANNTAIFGSVYAKKRQKGAKIITTDSEHSSVENAMKRLEDDGFTVVRLKTRGGVLDIEEFRASLDDSVILVSLMMVNNETGAVYDVERCFSLAKAKNPDIVTHCDAIQGFLKVPFTPKKIKADLVSVSAHKIHGPKGVGALFVSAEILKRRLLVPYLVGGGQESGFRSGTENMIGICGFSAAAVEGFSDFRVNFDKMTALREACIKMLDGSEIRVNKPSGKCAPHILSLTLPRIKSETMLNFLSSKGICVSSGSACSSHSRNISSALVGFGIPDTEADTTIRVSFSSYNTNDDVKSLVDALNEGVKTLVKIK